MTDTSLVYTITAFGTRTNTTLQELYKEVGTIYYDDLYQQMNRLVKEGKIEVIGDSVFIKRKME